MNNNYTGISFPFRLNPKGGITMSTTNPSDPKHIEEGLIQLLSTRKFERVMEANIGNTLNRHIFDSQDSTLYNMMKYEVIKAVKDQDARVTVNEDLTQVYGEDNKLIIELHYSIDKYDGEFTSRIKI